MMFEALIREILILYTTYHKIVLKCFQIWAYKKVGDMSDVLMANNHLE